MNVIIGCLFSAEAGLVPLGDELTVLSLGGAPNSHPQPLVGKHIFDMSETELDL